MFNNDINSILTHYRYCKLIHSSVIQYSWRLIACVCFLLINAFQPLHANTHEADIKATTKSSILIVFQDDRRFNQTLVDFMKRDLSRLNYNVTTLKLDTSQTLQQAVNNQLLIIAVGSKTTKHLLESQPDIPILSVLMPRHLANSLQTLFPNKTNWSSLLIDQPLERQFHLISSIMGEQQQAGILLGPYTDDMKTSLQIAAKKTHHKIKTHLIKNSEQISVSLESLNTQSSVLLTLPDPVIFNKNTIRGIILSSYRHKLPIIGFSRAYVKAGAIAAVYSQPEQISLQVSKIARNLATHGKFNQKKYYPEEFSIALNTQVARSLGIHLDEDAIILERIKKAER